MIRVFPSKTNATPTDALAFVGPRESDRKAKWNGAFPPLEQYRPSIQPVRISCTFTWDLPMANILAKEWGAYYPDVQVGGPAYGDPGGDFEPGLFLANGYVITSRGCPNRCDFCFVPKREGGLRSLPIRVGWNVLDNNLLACCDSHIDAVFQMLRWTRRCVRFTGGFEARRVTRHIIDLLQTVRLPVSEAALFLAYDRPGQDKVVRSTTDRLRRAGMVRRQIGCYILVGRNGETTEQADERLEYALTLGVLPFAMVWRGDDGKRPPGPWPALQRRWRQAAIYARHPGLD